MGRSIDNLRVVIPCDDYSYEQLQAMDSDQRGVIERLMDNYTAERSDTYNKNKGVISSSVNNRADTIDWNHPKYRKK